MGSQRKPGPTGTTSNAIDLNDGTLVRSPSPRPGPLRPDEAGSGPWLGVQGTTLRTSSAASGSAGDESRVIDALRVPMASVLLDGGRYRLARLHDWVGLLDLERHERISREVSFRLLTAESRRPEVGVAERSAYEAAAKLLADDRAGERDGGLLLLRVHHLRAPRQIDENPAMTPSQINSAIVEEVSADAVAEEHWVGLELQWEDGPPIEGAAYVVIAPDGRKFTGVTDIAGRALVVGLRTAGQCRISFPGLDSSGLTTT